MLSESARMSSAAEAAFRIHAPNSLPRATTVIALDARSEDLVRRLAEASWNRASFFTAGPFGDSPNSKHGFPVDGLLSDLAGSSRDLMSEVGTADLVVLIAGPGGNARAAALIGEACSLRRVMTTALVVGATSTSGQELSKTLAQLRPWSLMVVIADAEDYIEDMLKALRA